jgi:hypothetical protein
MQRYRGHSSDTGDTGDTLLESGVMPSPRRRQPIRRPAPHSPLPTPNSAVGILPAVRPSPRRCSALRGLEAHATIHPHGTLWCPHHHHSHGAVGILPTVRPPLRRCSALRGAGSPRHHSSPRNAVVPSPPSLPWCSGHPAHCAAATPEVFGPARAGSPRHHSSPRTHPQPPIKGTLLWEAEWPSATAVRCTGKSVPGSMKNPRSGGYVMTAHRSHGHFIAHRDSSAPPRTCRSQAAG